MTPPRHYYANAYYREYQTRTQGMIRAWDWRQMTMVTHTREVVLTSCFYNPSLHSCINSRIPLTWRYP